MGGYPFGKDNYMSKSEVSAPVSSVASDRMALGVGWVRPGAGGIGGTLLLKPDGYLWAYEPYGVTFFEVNEE
jgi:hypothetical protein